MRNDFCDAMMGNNRFLAEIFKNGVVIQRQKPINIWGIASPGAKITATFTGYEDDVIYRTVAEETGNWRITMPMLQAGGPYEMTVRADGESIFIDDILIGDVWICGGQSNMQLPMQRVKNVCSSEILNEVNRNIRQFAVPIKYDFKAEQDDYSGGSWVSVEQETLGQFTAAGFFFARKLYEKYGVPIGLILTAVGGTPIEAWMSRKALSKYPEALSLADKCRDDAYIAKVQADDKRRSDEWHNKLNNSDRGLNEKWYDFEYDDSNWSSIELCADWSENAELQGSGVAWLRYSVNVPESLAYKPVRLFLGCIVDADATYVNGERIGGTDYRYPPREYAIKGLKTGRNVIAVRVVVYRGKGGFVADKPYKLVWDTAEMNLESVPWKYRKGAQSEGLRLGTFFNYMPTGLYNAMISPIFGLGMKGVIWYQGESNTESPEGYSDKFRLLVEDWRSRWNEEMFPFLFVQLANFSQTEKADCGWPLIREEQRKSLLVPNTGMVVAIDIGEYNDLHPLDKKSVGERLALAAFNIAYGEDIVHSGPTPKCINIGGDLSQSGLNVDSKAVSTLCTSENIFSDYLIEIKFENVGGGLVTRDDGALKGFEICLNGSFVAVEATIVGCSVVVSCPKIEGVSAIRYAWADNPKEANLYNIEGLPATPFVLTTENIFQK